jgi:sigma-B regulation protein RsbU (phosphoserine phosphatase)
VTSRRRILVVDDEAGMLRAVQRILERSHDVTCASSPVEALALAPELRPDLAVVDVRMPEMDGFELTSRLKEAVPGVEVILMTGSAGDADQKLVQAIRHKAFYFIQKPFDREVLRTLVERCLELRRLADANRAHLERLEREMAQARAFQAGLLPRPEACFGPLLVEARYVPCDELCGDFYDYAAAGEGEVAFVVADVSGHGASAAMLTGVVKSAFHSCHREGYPPAAVADRIAAGICDFDANRFVTMFCAVLRAEDGLLRFASAGHPPALVWDAEGRIEPLAPTGGIISPALTGRAWRQESRVLRRDQHLLVYTDGVTEAPGEEGLFGDARLEDEIRRAARDPSRLLGGILGAVERFRQGRPPRDDLTLLSVRHD